MWQGKCIINRGNSSDNRYEQLIDSEWTLGEFSERQREFVHGQQILTYWTIR